jgi:hypothetical protein
MKRGTPTHPKTHQLAQLLGVHRLTAVGTLAHLWEWSARYAPQGDIGRWSADHIARSIEWPADPELLISSLVQSSWLCKASKPHHLLIHDWKDHAEDSVKKYLKRNNLEIYDCRILSRHVQTKSRQIAPAVAVAVAIANASAIASFGTPKETSGAVVAVPASPDEPAAAGAVVVVSPRKPADEETATAARHTACFNAALERRLGLTPETHAKTRALLKANYRPWQIVALPILVVAQGLTSEMRKQLTPQILLRDGKHARTIGGQTYGATHWLERALSRIDQTALDPRLAEIARQFGVLEQLMQCGVTIRQEIA